MGLPSVSEAVAAYAVDYIERCHSKGETYADVARRLQITPPHLTNVRSGRGAGMKLENAIATVLFGGSVDKLRREAQRWWEETGRMRSHVRKRERGEDPLPNRAFILDMLAPELHPNTVRRLREEPREIDMPKLSWVKLALFVDDEVRREAAAGEAQRVRRKPRLVSG
jgi:transcriptional regulator with XRE-family HTH domain